MKSIDMADWQVTEYQKQLVMEVLESGRLTYGDKTRQLEEKFAAIHGRKHALFTSSGTDALVISLHAMKDEYNWKDGDEVIVPALTFVATINAIIYNNLKPVLVDIKYDLNIDTRLIEHAITSRTRAIMPVHLLGQSADMTQIMEIAQEYKLKVIEDSCETMYVKYEGKPVGSMGDVACFSTYLAHLMVTGVGGFITTDDDRMATIMRSMMFHGRDEAYLNIDDNLKTGDDFNDMVRKRFLFTRQGYSARATEMEAALGLGELEKWQETLKKRQDNGEYLRSNLSDIEQIRFPYSEEKEHAFMMFPMLVQNRNRLVNYLEAKGVRTRHIMPLTNQPIMRRLLGRDIEHFYPHAKYINGNGILIGCHQYLEKKDLDYMIEKIKEFYE